MMMPRQTSARRKSHKVSLGTRKGQTRLGRRIHGASFPALASVVFRAPPPFLPHTRLVGLRFEGPLPYTNKIAPRVWISLNPADRPTILIGLLGSVLLDWTDGTKNLTELKMAILAKFKAQTRGGRR